MKLTMRSCTNRFITVNTPGRNSSDGWFLFLGNVILDIIGIQIGDFAIAGSILLFVIAFEMILGVKISKDEMSSTASVVPLAFPLIAGTGTLSTLLSIRAEYNIVSIIVAIVVNVIIVYFVLKYLTLIEKVLGAGGIATLWEAVIADVGVALLAILNAVRIQRIKI